MLINYELWMNSGGLTGQTTIGAVDWNPIVCLGSAFSIPGLKSIGILLLTGVGITAYVRFHDKFSSKDYDERGFTRSKYGTYGTASWMKDKELKEILEIKPPSQADGIILGEKNGSVVCLPKDTRLNRHIAVFGASGTRKSRGVIRPALFTILKRGESAVITDPKAELYNDTAELFRKNGYEVKVFNLVDPRHGDSWNCMSDLNGDTLLAQVLTNVIISNTSEGKGDHFWDNGEANLLKALVLYIDLDRSRGPETKNLAAAYQLLTQNSERQLTALFEKLPLDHPAVRRSIFSRRPATRCVPASSLDSAPGYRSYRTRLCGTSSAAAISISRRRASANAPTSSYSAIRTQRWRFCPRCSFRFYSSSWYAMPTARRSCAAKSRSTSSSMSSTMWASSAAQRTVRISPVRSALSAAVRSM